MVTNYWHPHTQNFLPLWESPASWTSLNRRTLQSWHWEKQAECSRADFGWIDSQILSTPVISEKYQAHTEESRWREAVSQSPLFSVLPYEGQPSLANSPLYTETMLFWEPWPVITPSDNYEAAQFLKDFPQSHPYFFPYINLQKVKSSTAKVAGKLSGVCKRPTRGLSEVWGGWGEGINHRLPSPHGWSDSKKAEI